MRDILGQQQLNSERIDDSIDEKWLRSRTPTEYINIVPKKMRFSGVDAEIIAKGYESYSSQQDFHSSMADTVMKVDKWTNTVNKSHSKVKLLKKELKQWSKTLQNSIQISSDLLNEIHRLGKFNV